MNGTDDNLGDNTNDICRLCLNNNSELVPIFDNTNLESFKIQLIIRDVCSIKVIQGDSLPKCICNECKEKLYCLYEFVSLCQESDVKLRKVRQTVSTCAQTENFHLEEESNERRSRESSNDYPISIKNEIVDIDERDYVANSLEVPEDNVMVVDDYEERKKHMEEWQNQMLLTRNYEQSTRSVEDQSKEDLKETVNQKVIRGATMQQSLWNVQAVITKGDETSQNWGEEMSEEDQLFGKDWPCEEMVYLQSDIYCRKSVFDVTHNASQKASHVARRLITGVFKPEAIKRCTLTGQTPRSLGRQRLNDKVDCLHVAARNAIINYSMYVAELKGWKAQTVPELKHALSQRLGELKREMKYAELQQY